MTLLVLMYHRAHAQKHGNSPDMLDQHFALLAKRTFNVLPGEPLKPSRPNVCLSFDDAYFDFYSVVFPMLKKHGLRAVLAVTPGLIRENVETSTEDRQNLPSDVAFSRPSLGGFCVWRELEEMSRSGYVEMAAHGYTHTAL